MKTTRDNILGVILAGGQSSRMGGGDKFLQEVAGKTLLQYAIDRLSPQIDEMIISANGDPNRLASYKLEVVKDPIEGYHGPLAGILAAMNWAKEHRAKVTHIVSIGADTPLFPDNLVSRMIEVNADSDETILLSRSNNRHHPVFGLWPVKLRDSLATALNKGIFKVRAWSDTHANGTVSFENISLKAHEVDPFFNINTPEQLSEFKALLTPGNDAS